MEDQTVGQAISPEIIAHLGCDIFCSCRKSVIAQGIPQCSRNYCTTFFRARGPDVDLQLFTDGLMCSDLMMQPGLYTHSSGMPMTHILVVKIFGTGIIALHLQSTLSPIRFLHFSRVYYLQLGRLPQLIALSSNMIVDCN